MARDWRELGRVVKRLIANRAAVEVAGRRFAVVYEARHAWEEHDYPFLMRLATGRRCVFDIGANKGITTLLTASVLAPGGKVYAFEPSQEACAIIRANVALNGLTERVELVDALVGERSGVCVPFFLDGASVFASIVAGHFADRRRSSEPLRKATMALDDFVSHEGIHPDVVKIDVEGAEDQVIRGMRGLLRQSRSTVFVEIHELPNRSLVDNVASILESLEDVEYRLVRVRTKTEVLGAEAFRDARGRSYGLLVPVESALPEWFGRFDTSRL